MRARLLSSIYLPSLLVRFLIYLTSPKLTAGAMVVWVADGQVLLVRSRHGQRRWGFPGGVLARREDPIDGARRELEEETGVVCASDDLVLAGTHVQQHSRHIEAVFRVRRPREEVAGPAVGAGSFEVAEVRWWPVDALPPLRREAEYVSERYAELLHPGD